MRSSTVDEVYYLLACLGRNGEGDGLLFSSFAAAALRVLLISPISRLGRRNRGYQIISSFVRYVSLSSRYHGANGILDGILAHVAFMREEHAPA